MNKKYNKHSILLVIGLAVIVYIYNDFLCSAANCYELEVAVFEPLFLGLLSILPTLLILLAFSEKVFVSWLKHIAWWSVLVVVWAVGSNSNESDFSPFADDAFVVLMSMSMLFIVTFIYALIMSRRFRKSL